MDLYLPNLQRIRRKKKEERRRKKYIGFCHVAFNKDLKRKSKSWFLEGER